MLILASSKDEKGITSVDSLGHIEQTPQNKSWTCIFV